MMAALPFGGDDRRDGVVGLAFAMRNIAQLLLMCDRHDIGLSVDGGTLERTTAYGRRRRAFPTALAAEPNIFIYDNYPGGIGFSRPLFEMHCCCSSARAISIVGCPCESGCPSCVGPEGNTGPHAKAVALRILDDVLLLLPGVALPDLDPAAMQLEKDGSDVDLKSRLRAIVKPQGRRRRRAARATRRRRGQSRYASSPTSPTSADTRPVRPSIALARSSAAGRLATPSASASSSIAATNPIAGTATSGLANASWMT